MKGSDVSLLSNFDKLFQPQGPFEVFSYCLPYLLGYRKNSKIGDTSNNCHNCPQNNKVWCNIALMHPKDAYGMANSVDLDQTASSEAV